MRRHDKRGLTEQMKPKQVAAVLAVIAAVPFLQGGGVLDVADDEGKIAFASVRDGNGEIYVMNADGKEVTRLTNNTAHDMEPAFSPDGSKIAFTSVRDGNSDIYVMNADGTGVTRLTNNPTRVGGRAAP